MSNVKKLSLADQRAWLGSSFGMDLLQRMESLAEICTAQAEVVRCQALPGSPPNANAHALEQDFTRAVHGILPSIVEIVSPSGLGSGVIFDDKGYVTNAHVVGKSASFEVRPSTGTRAYPVSDDPGEPVESASSV